jgi:organic radical activating enzyme
MKKIIKVKQVDNAPLLLTWVINNICNNSCSYCPKELHAGKNHNYDWEHAKRFFEILFKKYPKINLSVSGGEPSLSPFFKELVEIFHNAGHTIGLTSNAAKPAYYWNEIAKFVNYICFSYHPESPDENFIEKVKIASKNTIVTVRIMMHPQYWEHCVNLYNELCRDLLDFHIEPVKILPLFDEIPKEVIEYTDEQLAWFNSNPRKNGNVFRLSNKIILTDSTFYFDDDTVEKHSNIINYVNAGMTNFYGYTCEIGLKELYIHYTGQIQLGNCSTIGEGIGYIQDVDNIRWPTEPVICNKNLCHCDTSVSINKWIKQ